MTPLPAGTGPLFLDPSADALRAVFRDKPRALTDKLTTVQDAVARLVHDGDYLAIGGFGCARIPTAVVHEIVRDRRQRMISRTSAPATAPGADGHSPPSRAPMSSAWKRGVCRRMPGGFCNR